MQLSYIFTVVILATAVGGSLVTPDHETLWKGYKNTSRIIRGVNTGGWLILDPYVTPSIFEDASYVNTTGGSIFNSTRKIPKDEYTLTQTLDRYKAQSALEKHWSSFYRREDFSAMAELGLTHVRIPIGYWAFGLIAGDPYIQGQEKYLDDAIQWCSDAGIKVWINLQGLPGSQNGMPNSGRIKQTGWLEEKNLNITLHILDYISQKYGSSKYSDTVEGVQVASEVIPGTVPQTVIQQYYTRAYETLRRNSNVTVIFSDAFAAIEDWELLFSNNSTTSLTNIYVETHEFPALYPDGIRRPIQNKINSVCHEGLILKTSNLPVVVGEWSAALTDCAQFYNGVGIGHYYDGSFPNIPKGGSCAYDNNFEDWSIDDILKHRKYVEAQLEAWEQVGGWFFSNYKAENEAISWDLSRLVQNGVFPVPLNKRMHPGICGYNEVKNETATTQKKIT